MHRKRGGLRPRGGATQPVTIEEFPRSFPAEKIYLDGLKGAGAFGPHGGVTQPVTTEEFPRPFPAGEETGNRWSGEGKSCFEKAEKCPGRGGDAFIEGR